jgi:hypothetical protein
VHALDRDDPRDEGGAEERRDEQGALATGETAESVAGHGTSEAGLGSLRAGALAPICELLIIAHEQRSTQAGNANSFTRAVRGS